MAAVCTRRGYFVVLGQPYLGSSKAQLSGGPHGLGGALWRSSQVGRMGCSQALYFGFGRCWDSAPCARA